MSSLLSRWLIASLLLLAFTCRTSAQEAPPATAEPSSDAEKAADDSNPYAALRKSKSRATKVLADRYDDLISLNEWTDKNGRYKVKARYVEHDPDLKWVKLETVTGSGDKRVTKEVQLTLDKLNKPGQSRVRQIAALQRKLDELAKAEDADSTASPESPISIAEGRTAYGERGERGREREADGETTTAAAAADGPVDPTEWATSYAAFRANFSLAKDENGQHVLDWGELTELESLADNAVAPTDRGKEEPAAGTLVDAETAGRLGEVHWEAPLMKTQAQESGDHEVRFRLPALPRPLKVRFLLDPQEQYRTWADLPAGEKVQFSGTFASVGPREIVLRIRLADPATAPAPSEGEPVERR
jgi:hypothetical protein